MEKVCEGGGVVGRGGVWGGRYVGVEECVWEADAAYVHKPHSVSHVVQLNRLCVGDERRPLPLAVTGACTGFYR